MHLVGFHYKNSSRCKVLLYIKFELYCVARAHWSQVLWRLLPKNCYILRQTQKLTRSSRDRGELCISQSV